MARLVAGFGSSHSPMMVSPSTEWWDGTYIERDRTRALFDRNGHRRSFDEALALAPAEASSRIAPTLLKERHAEVQRAIRRMRDEIAAADLDALIVVGDDQQELFDLDNMPAIAVHYGSAIRNGGNGGPRRLVYPEPAGDRDYPCHDGLARHLISALMTDGFDVSAVAGASDDRPEGHAYSFVHRFLMGTDPVPIVPVFLNAYYEPNQPSPTRCLALGVAIAAAVGSFPHDARIAVMASGGLSHFLVDEELDRQVIAALQARDHDFLCNLPSHKLLSGSSEIRNWICLAGAVGDLALDWVTYVPGYRTPALTGTGLCLAGFK